MSEEDAAGDVTSQEPAPTDSTTAASANDLAGLREALAKERGLRRDAERKAKEGLGYKAKLDEFAAAQMTEQEKAVAKAAAEAEQRGRTSALATASERLARAEFRAAAAGRIDGIDELLEDLNLAKFVGEDGEPDLKAIKARVDKWAPQRAPDFDGGARSPAGKTTDMNALIRQRAGLG